MGGNFNEVCIFTRRDALKAGAVGTAVAAAPVFVKGAFAQDFRNDPGNASSIKLGFNVPQTGAYADEGADELRAYKLAVKHLNGGDGGMNTMKPLTLMVTVSWVRRLSTSRATHRPNLTQRAISAPHD